LRTTDVDCVLLFLPMS